jgi:hypothetical protein
MILLGFILIAAFSFADSTGLFVNKSVIPQLQSIKAEMQK